MGGKAPLSAITHASPQFAFASSAPAGDHAALVRANQALCLNFFGCLTGSATLLTEQSDRS